MMTKTEKFTVVVDKRDGKPVIAKNGNKCATTVSGINVWFPKEARLHSEITYKVHEKGDTFVAVKDSSRTKGEVMGADCPKGKKDEPLYYKGETVPRGSESVEFVGFAGEQIAELLSFEEKARILISMGVEIKL